MGKLGKRSPLRWSYVPGGYNNDSWRLRKAGVDVAVVAPTKGGWYSYGLAVPRDHGWNTASKPCSLDEAKADAIARARAALASATDAEGA